MLFSCDCPGGKVKDLMCSLSTLSLHTVRKDFFLVIALFLRGAALLDSIIYFSITGPILKFPL